jgi:hypothetical protein
MGMFCALVGATDRRHSEDKPMMDLGMMQLVLVVALEMTFMGVATWISQNKA